MCFGALIKWLGLQRGILPPASSNASTGSTVSVPSAPVEKPTWVMMNLAFLANNPLPQFNSSQELDLS